MTKMNWQRVNQENLINLRGGIEESSDSGPHRPHGRHRHRWGPWTIHKPALSKPYRTRRCRKCGDKQIKIK